MSFPQLILASSSKPRKALLKKLALPFKTLSPDIDETPLLGENAEQLVMRLAETKARKIAESHPEAIIIGADQVGVLDNCILGKPITYKNGTEQLKQMSGRRVEFFIGLCVLNAKDQSRQCALETYSVTFRHLTDSMIENYLNKEQALECAGSFKAEGLGIALVQAFHDTDFSALIGLPLIRLIRMLEKIGINPI